MLQTTNGGTEAHGPQHSHHVQNQLGSLGLLPTEMRNNIYELCEIAKESPIAILSMRPATPALLRTSRQLRQETNAIYWSDNTFDLSPISYHGYYGSRAAEEAAHLTYRWLSAVGSTNISLIRSFRSSGWLVRFLDPQEPYRLFWGDLQIPQNVMSSAFGYNLKSMTTENLHRVLTRVAAREGSPNMTKDDVFELMHALILGNKRVRLPFKGGKTSFYTGFEARVDEDCDRQA